VPDRPEGCKNLVGFCSCLATTFGSVAARPVRRMIPHLNRPEALSCSRSVTSSFASCSWQSCARTTLKSWNSPCYGTNWISCVDARSGHR
jgi:hypothetical protein